MLGDGLAIDQQDPVEITTRGDFLTGYRSKYNQASVWRHVSCELSGEAIAPGLGLDPRFTNRLPRGPDTRCKLI